jgi:rhodanese-related sulfurtransferase
LVLIALSVLAACKRAPEMSNQEVAVTETPAVKSEADLLLDYLAQTGDYVNSRQFPSMIKAPTVLESLKGNTHVIDLRDDASFKQGHIKGAVNVKFNDLPAYFEGTIKPFQYEKIVLVCYHGQMSSYATALLRLMGYGNVYSMRWGMAGWNPVFAKSNGWDKILSNRYASNLDTSTQVKPGKGKFPDLNTGKTTGEDILKGRMRIVFAEGFKAARIFADTVFAAPGNYFIINYERKDRYDSGHIPGAVRYKPNGTLGIPSEMLTIPAGKNIVVYCETGHNSAFVTAYLRLFGYPAQTLVYGNNGFMYEKMKQDKVLDWTTFNPDMIYNYPYVK